MATKDPATRLNDESIWFDSLVNRHETLGISSTPSIECRVLVVSPSKGLGGGIERYIATMLEALREQGRPVLEVSLNSPSGTGLRVKLGFLVALGRQLLGRRRYDVVAIMHPQLLAPCLPFLLLSRCHQIHVFFYGIDIWRYGRRASRLFRRFGRLKAMSISAFSQAELGRYGISSRILQPGLGRAWFQELAHTSEAPRNIDVLSVFRLQDWRDKGAVELCEATMREIPIRTLVLAGKGPAPTALVESVSRFPNVSIVESPSDHELAVLYGRAKIFALATRTRSGDQMSGEGFGIVLAEAQLGGAVVVAPVGGGSSDAYIEGSTGFMPSDESSSALGGCLEYLLAEDRWSHYGKLAKAWALEHYDPSAYAATAVDRLFPS